MAKEVKLFQPNMFMLRYFVFNRETGELNIYNKLNGKLKQTIHVSEMQHVTRQEYDQFKVNEYPEMFVLSTVQRKFFFFAATKKDRDIWVHTFSHYCTQQTEPLASLESDVERDINIAKGTFAKELIQHVSFVD